jgi:hypothetical protein
MTIHPEDLERIANPLKIDGGEPALARLEPGREDFAT